MDTSVKENVKSEKTYVKTSGKSGKLLKNQSMTNRHRVGRRNQGL